MRSALPFLCFGAQIVGVELSQANQHRKHQLTGRGGVIHVLRNRHKADAGLPEPVERLKRNGELRSLLEIVSPSALSFVTEFANYRPALCVAMVDRRPALRIKTVAIHLLSGTHKNINRRSLRRLSNVLALFTADC